MTGRIGFIPKQIYSLTDVANGVCPAAGTVVETVDANGREQAFVLCIVAAAQNLIDGTVVTFDSSYNVTVAAAGNPAANTASRLGVVSCSVTASASAPIWVQIFGHCSVLSSTSALPNITLSMSGTAGRVDDATTSLSAAIIGMYLLATASGVGSLTPAILNYPRFGYPGGQLS